MRNKQIYYATSKIRSTQTSCSLSGDLRKKFGKRSARIVKGDTVKILRGEFYGTAGKVTKILTRKNSITVDGVKREKAKKGENVDVPIHATNVIITALNDDDKWRMNKLQGNSKDSLKKIKQKEADERKINQKTKESKTKSTPETKKEKDVKK